MIRGSGLLDIEKKIVPENNVLKIPQSIQCYTSQELAYETRTEIDRHSILST